MKIDIHETLKQVNRYFVDKILAEEFEFIEIDKDHCMSIKLKVDGYPFYIWTHEGEPGYTYSQHEFGAFNFIKLNFTKEESTKIGEMIFRIWDEKYKDEQEKKDRAEYKRLKEKFEKRM